MARTYVQKPICQSSGCCIKNIAIHAKAPNIVKKRIRHRVAQDRKPLGGRADGSDVMNARGSFGLLDEVSLKQIVEDSARLEVTHGLALDQIFSEVRAGKHDLIVTGTSQARGPFRHYIMGDLTRGILNRAECPVLVARAGKIVDDEDAEGGFFHRLLHGFGAEKPA